MRANIPGVVTRCARRDPSPGPVRRASPRTDDLVVTKRRVGAFSTTDLETVLRAKNIDTLVLAGISTSVLSTVRWAADMDYKLAVVSDACATPLRRSTAS